MDRTRISLNLKSRSKQHDLTRQHFNDEPGATRLDLASVSGHLEYLLENNSGASRCCRGPWAA